MIIDDLVEFVVVLFVYCVICGFDFGIVIIGVVVFDILCSVVIFLEIIKCKKFIVDV